MRGALICLMRARVVLMMRRHRRRIPHAGIGHSRRCNWIAHVVLLLLGCVVGIDVHHIAFVISWTHMLRRAEMVRIVLWVMRVLHVRLLVHWWRHWWRHWWCKRIGAGVGVC